MTDSNASRVVAGVEPERTSCRWRRFRFFAGFADRICIRDPGPVATVFLVEVNNAGTQPFANCRLRYEYWQHQKVAPLAFFLGLAGRFFCGRVSIASLGCCAFFGNVLCQGGGAVKSQYKKAR